MRERDRRGRREGEKMERKRSERDARQKGCEMGRKWGRGEKGEGVRGRDVNSDN